MNKELKLCPFCEGKVKMDNEQITATITVDYFICEKCGATVHFEYADKTAESIEAWNTRKPIDNIVEQLEELIQGCEEVFADSIALEDLQMRTASRNQAIALKQAIEIVKDQFTDADKMGGGGNEQT